VPAIPSTGLNDTSNSTHLTAVGNTENALQESQNEDAVQKLKIEDGIKLTNQPSIQDQMGNGDFDSNLPASDQLFTTTFPADGLPAVVNQTMMHQDPNALDLLAGVAGQGIPYQSSVFEHIAQGLHLQPAPQFQDAQEPLNFGDGYYLKQEETTHDVEGFARLDFPDGSVYMNTYSIVLGRDQVAAEAAKRREKREARRLAKQQSHSDDPRTPMQIKREGSRYTKSVASESGGIIRVGEASDSEDLQQRRVSRKNSKRSKKSRSESSSDQGMSGRNSLPGARFEQPEYDIHLAPDAANGVPPDPNMCRPDVETVPLVCIHPGRAAPFGSYKNISREHLKIACNLEKHTWEGYVLGRNGVFMDDEFYPRDTVMTLTSGCKMQIGSIEFRFHVPDIAFGETGVEQRAREEAYPSTYSEGGKEMSFDFEHDTRAGAMGSDNSDEDSEDEPTARLEEDPEGSSDENEVYDQDPVEIEDVQEEEEESDGEGDGQSPSSDHHAEPPPDERPLPKAPEKPPQPDPKAPPEKKRGPGRPPKDGIMSKREKQLAKKALLAQVDDKSAKKTVPDAPVAPPKNKVGRPRKHPIPEPSAEPRTKRKYTKRKPKEPKEGDGQEGAGGSDQATSTKKEKPEKREERSPSPVWDWPSLTPEQLAKPTQNYVQLIYDVLINSDKGPSLSLPQIYRRMQRKYPYFCHEKTTVGWQSSVRHNLGQHDAFIKVDREGKGYRWGLRPGATIEKEKKRRTTPPQQHPGHMNHQPIYTHPYPMTQGQPYPPPPHMRGPPPGYPYVMPPPGQYPYMGPPPPHVQANGQMPPPGPYPHLNGPLPPGIPAIMPPALAAPNAPGSYSSPYAPKPPASNESLPNQQQSPQEESSKNHDQEAHGHMPQQPPLQNLSQNEQVQAPPIPQEKSQPQPPQQQPPPQSLPSPTPAKSNGTGPNDVTLTAIAAFKNTIISSKNSEPNLLAIVESATNQVLGYSNQSSLGEADQKQELLIIAAMKSLLDNIPRTNLSQISQTRSLSDQDRQSQPHTTGPQTNQKGTQATAPSGPQHSIKSSGLEKSTSTIMRPQFNGHGHGHQSRPNMPIPRPQLTKRTDSGSPATAPARANTTSESPAPSGALANGASTPMLAVGEIIATGQMAGQKRTHDEAALETDGNETPDFKRLSTSGPPQLTT
jgi:hypothetical protein